MSYNPPTYPDARQMTYLSNFSTLTGALEPAPVQYMNYPVRPNATSGLTMKPLPEILRPPQTSSGPDLAGALGGTKQNTQYQASPYGAAPTAPYSAVPHPSNGSYAGSSSAHPAYPYPERNVVHPSHYAAAHQKTYQTVIPAGYHLLPEIEGVEKHEPPTSWNRIGSQHATIKFNRKGGGKPFSVKELIDQFPNMPDVEGNQDQVFSNIGERAIKVVVIWPGYGQHPMEKRIATDNGSLTKEKLLYTLAKNMEGLVDIVRRRHVPVERDFKDYEISVLQRGLPKILRDCLITRLYHKSGSTWAVEIYVRIQ
ncbi:hypothetical protein DEU56DRAFT_340051 [Suillus clintonianus]|uniref:uncharacterized protein n=1 Tax=Suillus clintonianus TaxID=1904413 RepID=UPI001B866A0F|nr:uncharacterized protein DEU56DRAFT_340051 [Suillus clintonianus]KAG2138309.1 hypothetical protein DEU56DRAFT_340051 [Suillus clintonianus]